MSAQPPPTYRALDASRLSITLKQDLSNGDDASEPPSNDPAAGAPAKRFTDHMLVVDWTASHGWSDPAIVPHGGLAIMPTASVLHYGTCCFEGTKLYRGVDGKLRLFRPGLNAARLARSAARISVPADFSQPDLVELLRRLCAVDAPRWLPGRGQALYLRPTLVGTDASLGGEPPRAAKLFAVLSTYVTVPDVGSGGMRLVANRVGEDGVRAWPGGTGGAKIGGNYGPTFRSLQRARDTGFDLNLWLFGPGELVTECGGSNFFVIWRRREQDGGELEMITSTLDQGLILPGITRKSLLELTRKRLAEGGSGTDGLAPLRVTERDFTMAEFAAAHEEGRLVSAFGVGTAYFISPVRHISWAGKGLDLRSGECGYVEAFQRWLKEIKYGMVQSDWMVEVEESGA